MIILYRYKEHQRRGWGQPGRALWPFGLQEVMVYNIFRYRVSQRNKVEIII
jgi:hypothetical protein